MNTGFVNGHVEQTTDFDYDEVDRRLAGDDELVVPITEAVTAAKLFHHVLTMGAASPVEMFRWINIFMYIMGLHPNQNESGENIGASLRMSKQEFFRRVNKMRKIFKARGLTIPRIAGEWKMDARASIAHSAIQRWQKRGGRVMLRTNELDKKLCWIAEWAGQIDLSQYPLLAREELKAKLKPVVKLAKEL